MNQDLFQWSDDFNIGLPKIDEQHKELVRLLNALHIALREQSAPEDSREILDTLADHTRMHFAVEEGMMRVSEYPGLAGHKQNHADLLGQVRALQNKLDAGQATISFELLHFLKHWLIHHINESDKYFGDYYCASDDQLFGVGLPQDSLGVRKPWWKLW